MESLELSASFPATSAEVFAAWADAEMHSEMTGAPATGRTEAGQPFTAWDGYITGKTLSVEPGRRIVQAWRTSEFPEDAPDSALEVLFEDVAGAARVTIRHTDLPPGGAAKYTEGWEQFYFAPMRACFQVK
ncbi:MAG: SRPBCC domain-containing protein [Pseudomonadota bacterium]|nr:SRPBCC domain-containing protein [Pseudomonadota bacterium]